ncbi:hypothetical protein ACFQ0B_04590 [Nonomuraea thailandensis]
MDLVWPVVAWALWVAMLVTAFKVSNRHDPGQGADAPRPPPWPTSYAACGPRRCSTRRCSSWPGAAG